MQQSKYNIKLIGDITGANVYAPITWGRGSETLFKGENVASKGIPITYKNQFPDNRENSLNFSQYLIYNPLMYIKHYSTMKILNLILMGRFLINSLIIFMLFFAAIKKIT